VGGRRGAGRGEVGRAAAAREEDGRAIAARGEGRRRGERQHRGGWRREEEGDFVGVCGGEGERIGPQTP
jgi:hypothetical protein